MKKILIIFIFISNSFSSNENYELQLYEKVLSSIFKKKIFVYSNNKDILQNSNILTLTLDCKKADVLLGKKFNNLPIECQNKPIFSTSRRGFKDSKNTIGALYWRKGRPQIKFKQDTLKRYNLKLPQSLLEFAQ